MSSPLPRLARRRRARLLPLALAIGSVSSPANGEPPEATPGATPSPPSTPPAPAPEPSAADEAAAIAAALSTSSSETTLGDQQKLNLYGFADFTYSKAFEYGGAFSPYESFAVGHLNLYAGSELGDDWRWLSEVRFMYLPNGSVPASQAFAPGAATDTSVTDYTDFQRPVRWGGINIERAWLERTFHPLLTIRMGQFPTPYGIWNVDHGSPVIIPVTRPYIVGEQTFPGSQTGIEIYGTWNVQTTQLGYHFTLSNGRGPIDTYQDLDHNKAVGGRLYVRQDTSLGTWTLGISGYRGQYTQRHTVNAVDASGAPSLTYPVDVQYNELSLATDLKWEWGGLLVQGEAMLNDVGYLPGGRPVDPLQALAGGPPGFTADYRRYGYYGLVGYRLPFLGIMPYIFAEDYWQGFTGYAAAAVRPGLNIRPTPRVVLKGELVHVWFHDTPVRIFPPGNALIFQAAWSF